MILGTRVSRIRYLLLAGALALAFILLAPRIPQDENYHQFAGSSPWPTTLTNLAFVLIGAWWLWKSPQPSPARLAALGVFLTGFGSAYYHLAPDNTRLVWDRLPMTIVFMSVLSAVLEEWAGLRGWRWPLIGFGLASVLWWQFSGDLKVYVLVQFGPAGAGGDDRFPDARDLEVRSGMWRRKYSRYSTLKSTMRSDLVCTH